MVVHQRSDPRAHAAPRAGERARLHAQTGAPPLWPLRALALAGAGAQAVDDLSRERWPTIAAFAAVALYAVAASWRPIPCRDDTGVRLRIAAEQAFHTVVVLLTGAWPSPFALCLVPTGMLAGFAVGTFFASQLAVVTVALVSVQHIAAHGLAEGLQVSLLWAGLLGLVAFTSGLSHRAAIHAANDRQTTLQRVGRLSEANSLLVALQRLAQTLPASLDLDEVVDTTFRRIESIVPATTVAVYLLDEGDPQLHHHRHRGATVRPLVVADAGPPEALRHALDAPRTVRVAELSAGEGISSGAQSGIYTGLRARGALIGALVVESTRPDAFTQQHVEVVHGLSEAFGISIENARLFRRIRTLAADEERCRIARDLHDQVGSSLAFLGFEVDRAQSAAERGGDVVGALAELREHLTAVIAEVREKLSDLRTDVSDAHDLGATVRDHLVRVEQRSGIGTELHLHTTERAPRRQEHELWQIALEALTNVERHARADHVTVEYTVAAGRVRLRIADDGDGVGSAGAPGTGRHDRYGMVGMRERADSIGARLQIGPNGSRGTAVTVDLDLPDPDPAGQHLPGEVPA